MDFKSLSSAILGRFRNEVERLVVVILGGVSRSHSHLLNRFAVPFEYETAALSRSYMAFMMEANF